MKSIDEYYDLKEIPTHEIVTKQLPTDSVIIDIIRIQKTVRKTIQTNYFAFVIDENISLVRLNNSIELENDFYKYYLKQVQRKAVDIRSFNNYCGQFNKFIEDKNNIFFTSQGVYNLINIENLLTPENEFLFENKKLYLFNNYFSKISSKNDCSNDAVIVGSPKFENNENTKFIEPPEYIPKQLSCEYTDIPYSEEEGRSISEILKRSGYKTVEYYNEAANIENLNLIRNPKIFHIATHSFNFQYPVKGSGISDWENFSGLLMADSIISKNGNKYYNNSGLLYSQNIKLFNLENTKLGVLSSCNSGTGLILSNGGFIGIQKAIFIAGVKDLIVSLWVIEDKITQEFMVAFYSEWVKQENTNKSFEIAKTAIKEKYIHPFYWAGFRVIHNSLQIILGNGND